MNNIKNLIKFIILAFIASALFVLTYTGKLSEYSIWLRYESSIPVGIIYIILICAIFMLSLTLIEFNGKEDI